MFLLGIVRHNISSVIKSMYVATLTLFVFLFQSDILDVNQIFKDLGTMVYEQGEMIGKCKGFYNWFNHISTVSPKLL